jgi:hypothetical protein
MAKNSKQSRRDFLKNSGVSLFGLSRFGALSTLIVNSIINKSIAQTNGVNKMYLYLQQYGAPSRWSWDLPLTPDGNTSKLIRTPFIGTCFSGGARNDKLEYATKLVNGLHMPWVWGFDVATPNGFAPMANLMDGMMIMRGASSTNPGHESAARLHFLPLGSNYSVSALAADVSNAPIAGINAGAVKYEFRSRKGKSAAEYEAGGGTNLIALAMAPFKAEKLTSYESDQSKVVDALEASMNALSSFSKKNNLLAEIIENNTKDAINFFKADYGDLNVVYNRLRDKYIDLIKRTIAPSRALVGLYDKPLGTTGTRGAEYVYGTAVANQADMRNVIANSTNMSVTAEKFAFAEFMLTNQLTSSLSMSILGLQNLDMGGANSQQFFDEHSGGAFSATLINIISNMGLSACLYELISQLKLKGLYENTVIDVGGEFGRIPDGTGSGSDHSAEATSNLILSGAIDGSHVVGNIVANNGGQPGTWGYQGVNPTYGLLNVGHFGASVAMLLGAESPVTAVPSILELQSNGKFKPKLPTGTIV